MVKLMIHLFRLMVLIIETKGQSVNYRPQTKFAKVMFSQVSVCPQGVSASGPGRGVSTPGPLGRHPPGQTPPWQTPRQTPPWTDTPSLPSACWDTPPCPVHAGIHTLPAQCMLGYGQQVGGTHPTGMHSC